MTPRPPRRADGAPRRAAVYLRVSTDEQSLEAQRPDVERIVQARGLDLVERYEEHASAVRARPEFRRMMDDARRGRFEVLVVWALDRLGRSMVGNLQSVLELDRCGVQVISFRETWLDTSGPVRDLLVAIFSWVAQQEREQLVARTRAGLDRARRKGVKLGRPTRRIDQLPMVEELEAQGMSLRAIARKLRVPLTTLHRALGRSGKGVVPEPVQEP